MKIYKILEWDSKFFGYRVAQISESVKELEMVLDKLKKDNVHLAYYFVDPNNGEANKIAKKNGGQLVDTKILFKLDKIPDILGLDRGIVSYLHKPLNETLISLSLQAGFYSRYRTDLNFKKNEWKKLYKIWINRSLKAEIADEVYVCKEKEIEIGFVSFKVVNNEIEIGLVSVDSLYRGRGVATKLFNMIFDYSKKSGINIIKVATQEKNLPAMKFYVKLGFEIVERKNVYHFWL